MVSLIGHIDVAIGIHGDAVDLIEEDLTILEIAGFVGSAGEEPELVGFVNGGLQDEDEIAGVVRVVLRGPGKNPPEGGIRPSVWAKESPVEARGGQRAGRTGRADEAGEINVRSLEIEILGRKCRKSDLRTERGNEGVEHHIDFLGGRDAVKREKERRSVAIADRA